MAFNLTGTSQTFNASGKFGYSLNGGRATCANPFPTGGTFTIEVWLKQPTNNASQIPVGCGNTMYFSVYNGNITAKYGSGGGETQIGPGTPILDNAWHHVALVVTPSGGKFFVDGVVVGTNAGTATSTGVQYTGTFELMTFQNSFNWGGDIDEVAIYSTAKYTANFTPSATPISNTDAGIVALWHLDNDLLDSAGVVGPATAITATPPTSGTVGSASTAWTIGANGAITGTVVVTPSDGGAGGTFTPSTASISTGTPTVSMTYTAASSGAKTLSFTNNGGLTNPSNTTYTASASDTTAPVFGSAQVANATPARIDITMVETSGALAASVPPTSAFTASGGRTVTGVAIVGLVVQVTVNTAYAYGDTITIAYTQPGANPRLQDASANLTATFAAQAVTNNVAAAPVNALTGHTGNVLFSPYTWDIQANTAKTINAGAYFKVIFGGTSCTLTFDTSITASTNMPQLSYRVDRHGAWITVPLAASIAITIPSELADYANKGGHFLEVLVKSTSETQSRWSTQTVGVVLTGIVLDTGKTISAPPALPLKGIFYGDSITEGVRTVNATATYDTDRNDASQCWSLEAARILGAEIGNVGFGGSGFLNGGSGGVPALTSSYNYLYSGVARSFAAQPDFVVFMEGTNDGNPGGTIFKDAVITVLNGILAATTTTKLIVISPFASGHEPDLQAAIAACTAPSRCTFINGAVQALFNSTNSADGLHPYGNENITHIGPAVANIIRTALASGSGTTSRTAAVTLGLDATTPAANLSNLSWTYQDSYNGAVLSSGTTGTTNSSGVFSQSVQTTLASGGSGKIKIEGAAGLHFNGTVVLA